MERIRDVAGESKMWQVYYMVRAGKWLVILQFPRGLTS